MPGSIAVLGNFPHLASWNGVGAVAVVEQKGLIKLKASLSEKKIKVAEKQKKQ